MFIKVRRIEKVVLHNAVLQERVVGAQLSQRRLLHWEPGIHDRRDLGRATTQHSVNTGVVQHSLLDHRRLLTKGFGARRVTKACDLLAFQRG